MTVTDLLADLDGLAADLADAMAAHAATKTALDEAKSAYLAAAPEDQTRTLPNGVKVRKAWRSELRGGLDRDAFRRRLLNRHGVSQGQGRRRLLDAAVLDLVAPRKARRKWAEHGLDIGKVYRSPESKWSLEFRYPDDDDTAVALAEALGDREAA